MPRGASARALRRPLRAALYVILLAGVAALAGGLASFRRYVEESPRFCQSCHVIAPEVALWVESEHRSIRCQACHHQTLTEGLGILRAFIIGSAPGLEHARVDIRSCASCHLSHDSQWPSIAASRGHQVHVEKAKLECTECHGEQMHFDQPKRRTCAACHEEQDVGPAHEESHCLACHDFLSDEETVTPRRWDCLSCHMRQEKPVVISETSAMHFDCSTCHRPHQHDDVVSCADCHRPRQLHGSHATHREVPCGDCHPAHDWATHLEHCFGCHDDYRDHETGRSCTECHRFKRGLSARPR